MMFDFEDALAKVQSDRATRVAEEKRKQQDIEDKLDALFAPLQSFIVSRELEVSVRRELGKIVMTGKRTGALEINYSEAAQYSVRNTGAIYGGGKINHNSLSPDEVTKLLVGFLVPA